MDYEYACLTLVYMNCYLNDVLMTMHIILLKLYVFWIFLLMP